jgi:hypothetical protein
MVPHPDANPSTMPRPTYRLALKLAEEQAAASAADPDGEGLLDDAEAMRLAEWTYLNVEEVWSAFNLLSEAVARGFRVTYGSGERQRADVKRLQADVDAWNDRVHMADKVRMWVKNALIYGRCTMEVTRDCLKVRNPRFIGLEHDESGLLVGAWQDRDGTKRPIPVQRMRIFTLHRLFSDDHRGISAVHPVLQTVDDMLEARNVNRAVGKRYRSPMRIIELPADATEGDMQALMELLRKPAAGTDLLLPPGAKVHVLNHGKDALQPDELMRAHLTDRIFLGLGVPKVALGIPDGSNTSVSQVQREMLLADKVAPYQRQVKEFAEGLYKELFGAKPTVRFEPVDVRDEREIAEVSRVLVEAGIKTPEEVAERYWRWGVE